MKNVIVLIILLLASSAFAQFGPTFESEGSGSGVPDGTADGQVLTWDLAGDSTSWVSPIPVSSGGTGATTAAAARTSLGVPVVADATADGQLLVGAADGSWDASAYLTIKETSSAYTSFFQGSGLIFRVGPVYGLYGTGPGIKTREAATLTEANLRHRYAENSGLGGLEDKPTIVANGKTGMTVDGSGTYPTTTIFGGAASGAVGTALTVENPETGADGGGVGIDFVHDDALDSPHTLAQIQASWLNEPGTTEVAWSGANRYDFGGDIFLYPSINPYIILLKNSVSSNAEIQFKTTAGGTDWHIGSADGTPAWSDGESFFIGMGSSTNTTPSVVVDKNGNVGINTTAPGRKLDVLDASNPQIRASYDATTYAEFQADASGDTQYTNTGTKHVFDGFVTDTVDARTIADTGDANAGTLTLTPTTGYVELTCNDSNGCDITMGETGMAQGMKIEIINVSANSCNFADTAGVSETSGVVNLGQYDVIAFRYISDRWVERGQINN
jgi:hypothetical protein